MNNIEKELANWRSVSVPDEKRNQVYHQWFGAFPLLRWLAGAGIGLFVGSAGIATAAPGSPFYPVKQAVQAHLVVEQPTPKPLVVLPTSTPMVTVQPTETSKPEATKAEVPIVVTPRPTTVVSPTVTPTLIPIGVAVTAKITPDPTSGPSVDASVRIPAIIVPTPITVELKLPVPLPIDRVLPDISL